MELCMSVRNRSTIGAIATALFVGAGGVLAISLDSGADPHRPAPHRITPSPVAAQYLDWIEIYYEEPDGSTNSYVPEQLQRIDDVIVIHPDLGIPYVHRIVLLRRPDFSGGFRVEQQHETSLTLMNEGPHMDLTSWKHSVSPWTVVHRISDDVFRTDDISGSLDFPKVTTEEIVEAVKAESLAWAARGHDSVDRWVELAKECADPYSYPCGVGVSQLRFRISISIDDSWQPIQTIELNIPMGC
jgi:hypothetical protein